MLQIPLTQRCVRCNHPWTFHGKKMGKTCAAMGCSGGPDGVRCPGFVLRDSKVVYFQEPALA